MAAELLAAEADVSLSFTTDQAAGRWVLVRFTPATLDGTLNLVGTPPNNGTPVEVLLPSPLPTEGRIFVPANWTVHFAFDTYVSGAVLVEIIPLANLPALTAMWPNADMIVGAVDAGKVAAAIVSVDAVVTDLEGDVAGDSVAGAITDLEAVITALGA